MIGITLSAMMMAPVAGHCAKGTEDLPSLCTARLPRIVAISIEQNGAMAYRDETGPPSCAKFTLSRAQVARYLAGASTTDQASADATLDRSPCYARGQVRFANGQRGLWKIEQFGVGTIDWPKGQTKLLYCLSCTFAPFKR